MQRLVDPLRLKILFDIDNDRSDRHHHDLNRWSVGGKQLAAGEGTDRDAELGKGDFFEFIPYRCGSFGRQLVY